MAQAKGVEVPDGRHGAGKAIAEIVQVLRQPAADPAVAPDMLGIKRPVAEPIACQQGDALILPAAAMVVIDREAGIVPDRNAQCLCAHQEVGVLGGAERRARPEPFVKRPDQATDIGAEGQIGPITKPPGNTPGSAIIG